MKKILMALAITAFAYTGAEAQEQTKLKDCGVDEHQVCTHGENHTQACYKTNYAQNYKVCKGANGYYVCCSANDPAAINTAYTGGEVKTLYQFEETIPGSNTYYLNNGNGERRVCNESTRSGAVSCYQTENAQNYKVCKGENGYYICGR